MTPPVLDFDDLQYDFKKRTWNFARDRAIFGESNPRLLHWIGSVDYSGYVREKCLKYLINNYHLGDENRILLRLEDWVEPIQQLALLWTKNNFHKLSLAQIERNHRLILYLARKDRLNSQEAMQRGLGGLPHERHSTQRVQSPEGTLAHCAVQEAIELINHNLIEKAKFLEISEFYKFDSNFRNYLYRLIPRSHFLRPFLIKDPDPNNRLILIDLIGIDKLTIDEVESLSHDKCASIKKRLLYARLKQGIKPSHTELTRLALDKNKGVREIATYYLAKLYSVDAEQIYRQRTDEKFYYIADFAKPEDLSHFIVGMNSDNKRIKLLCFKALCHINPDYVKQFDLKQLIVENNKFRQLIIRRVLPTLPLSKIQNYQSFLSTTVKGTSIYLKLLSKKSYWHFINCCLELIISNPTSDNIDYILQIFYRQNDVYQKLPTELKSSIANKIISLEQQEDTRLQEFVRQLKFTIKYA